MDSPPFQKIAVIGSGTMGSGIAGQIANAGHSVLLLDLPLDDDANGRSRSAVERLLKSDPPALFHKDRASLIECGNIRDDFAALSACDWIIEAVIERLSVKQDLYRRLAETINDDCIVTSNTSTIPLSLLTDGMDSGFKARFAITHYFNPPRYMRLLELVGGTDTRPDVLARLTDYNDRFLGKGVVLCNDTPGFLGNRVGVYALQVGLDEAVRRGLSIEAADALMGRPMGIPKTGVFGLYDLIGIDLMADVVSTLGDILPQGDAFHSVGAGNILNPFIRKMIDEGFTGDKGRGGFYRLSDDGKPLSVDLQDGTVRPRDMALPPPALRAAAAQENGTEPLLHLLSSPDAGDDSFIGFSRGVLGRVLAYAADLLGDVTDSPQAIDDAMKLGFNWLRGPFEIMDAIGHSAAAALIAEQGLTVPSFLHEASGDFYSVVDGGLLVRHFSSGEKAGDLQPLDWPLGTIRFHQYRRCLAPLLRNPSASLYALGDDLRLVEFHSKANALTADSMAVVAAAAGDHGKGIIIHNDAQHFSAGVDLRRFLSFIQAGDWPQIDGFLSDFQSAVKALKYAPVPVVAAASGLTLGGGYEVVAHADKLIAHGNIVLGLVESAVGVVPGGGGVKDTFLRWYQATGDWEKSAWQTWLQIGYAKTGASCETAAGLKYFLKSRDESVMNRDKLLGLAIKAVSHLSQNYAPPPPPIFTLPGNDLKIKMADFMDDGIDKGLFFPHDKTVAMAIADIIVSDTPDAMTASEDDLFARERRSFIALAKTKETKARIESMLNTGNILRN